MLEEYVCLGGNEVANNARAYGYATSAGCPSSWFRCLPCESIHDVTTDWIPPTYRTYEIARNLATNPSFEKAGAAVVLHTNLATNPSFEATTAATVEVRRNRVPNPRAVAAGGLYGMTGGRPITYPGDGYARATSDGTGTFYIYPAPSAADNTPGSPGFSINVGERIATRIAVRNANATAQECELRIVQYNASGGYVGEAPGPRITVAAGQTGLLEFITTISGTPAGTVTYLPIVYWCDGSGNRGPGPVGTTLDIGQCATYRDSVQTPVPFFAGDSLPAGDFTYAWSGPVNASASVEYGTAVPDTGNGGSSTRIVQSTEWAASGSRSARVISMGLSADNHASPGGDNGALRLGMQAGKTYTVRATLRIAKPHTGTTYDARARSICVHWGTGGSLDQGNSGSSPNVAGVYEHTFTFTIPAGGNNAFIRLYNGSNGAGDEVWWDNFMLVEGTYNGPYFDGSIPAKVRRNYIPSPRLAVGWAGWANSYVTPTPNGTIVGTRGNGPTSKVTYYAPAFPVGPSEVWAASYDVSLAEGKPPVTVKLSLNHSAVPGGEAMWSDEGFERYGPEVTIQPGETKRVYSALQPSPPKVCQVSVNICTGPVDWPYGTEVLVSNMILEKATTHRPYFDGSHTVAPFLAGWEGAVDASASYLYDPDYTYAWTGAPNASPSTQSAFSVADVTPAGAVALTQSTQWQSNRSKSMRITPLTASADTAASPGGDTGGMRLGMQAGKTYTVSAKVRLAAPTTAIAPGNIIAFWRDGGVYQNAQTPPAPNVAGVTQQTLTFTIPPGATEAFIRLYNGAAAGGGDVWWDDFILTEGEGSVQYFDGDSAESTPDDDIRWAGAPDASQSIWERTTVENQGHSESPPYVLSSIYDAPWYDSQYPDLTGRFYGVFVLGIENLNSSTRTATVTEGILDGGVVGLVRHTTREMRTRAILVADGEDALEYGLAWLSAALASDTCSTHGNSCGAVDMTFFASCPDSPDPNSTVTIEVPETRHIHNVTVTSGPLVEQKIKSSDRVHYGYIVEWTMVAGTPWVFSDTKEVAVNLQPPVVVQDVPYNLVPFPSAELSNGTVTLATNYVTNPSIETDASGWSVGANVITPGPTVTRSTEIAASGTASLKVATTTTNSGTVASAGNLFAYRDVALPAFVTGQRFSFTAWAALFVVSGTASLTGTKMVIEWRDASSAVRSDTIGTGLSSGGAISATSLTRPPTAITARVFLIGEVTSWSVGALLNMFVDAVAVTIP